MPEACGGPLNDPDEGPTPMHIRRPVLKPEVKKPQAGLPRPR